VFPKNAVDPFLDVNLLRYIMSSKHSAALTPGQRRRVEHSARPYHYDSGLDLVYALRLDPATGNKTLRKVVVPTTLARLDIVQRAHLLGHFAADTTYSRVAQDFAWPGMQAQIRCYVDTCVPCLRAKVDHSSPVAPQAGELPTPGTIFDRVHIDLVMGFPRTAAGHHGLLTIVDAASKYAQAYAITSKSALEISQHLFSWISTFGPPRVIVSDNGTEFVNSVVAALSELFGVERAVTSPYHPAANGQVERFNATITAALRAHSFQNPLRWTEWLQFVLFAYNTRVHSTTDVSPYSYVFGRDPPAFVSAITDPAITLASPGGGESDSLDQRAAELRQLVESTRPTANERIAAASLQQRQASDARQSGAIDSLTDNTALAPGQTVWVRIGGHLVGKLSSRYAGPYTVVRRNQSGLYVLLSASGVQLSRAVRRDRIKVQRTSSVVDDTSVFRVETILTHRLGASGTEFLVKWVGYPVSDNSWEPEGSFVDLSAIEAYWTALGQPTPAPGMLDSE